jgi:hypothetical protein
LSKSGAMRRRSTYPSRRLPGRAGPQAWARRAAVGCRPAVGRRASRTAGACRRRGLPKADRIVDVPTRWQPVSP